MTKNSTLRPYVAAPYSYAFGRSNKLLKYETIDQALRSTVKRQPDQLAIASVHENVEWTFYQLEERVEKLSQILAKKLLVTRGDVVVIMTANTCKFVVIQYACARIGAIFCPINAYYQSKELEYSLHKVNPKVFFIPGPGSPQEAKVNRFYDVFTVIADNLPQSLQHVVLLDGELPAVLSPKVSNIHTYSSLENYCWQVDSGIESEDSDTESKSASDEDTKDVIKPFSSSEIFSIEHVDAEEPCSLFFTSGTTGPFKAAAHSHFSLLNNTQFYGKKLGFNDGKTVKICFPVPIFHAIGSVLGAITMSTCGISLVLPEFRYDIESTVQVIRNSECTHLMSVPAMLIDLIKYVEDHELKIPNLRGIITTACAVPNGVIQKLCKVLPDIETVHIVYGTSETIIITTPKPNDCMENILDNVGIPLDHTEVKIIDRTSGNIVKIGETGELLTRGSQVFLGYWGDEVQTKKAINSRGWYRTGDLATMDDDGHIRLVGRAKDIIIRGGMNIYPKEIEDVLTTNPCIADAVVLGLPHDRLGEDVCAWIRFRDSCVKLNEKEVKEYCKGKMAYFKIPRWIFFTTEFPISVSGKVQKFRLRELSCEILEKKELLMKEKTSTPNITM
ncbi:medium-chain acyl-CoA ligase ACSF2, mitochondrial-like [Brevipalpus obovatus]|uniref:medium-chain acyl-CoA ligase ACSF2, mitochondrial-like n=1 Tax=Brevipalpus obovatus TaxID=246614 RepID=UPI003D9FAC84